MSDKEVKEMEAAGDGADKHFSKAGIVELAATHGFLGPLAGTVQTKLQCGCKVHVSRQEEGSQKGDYYDVVDSFLNCVKYQETRKQDDGDNSPFLRIRKTKVLIKKYKEAFLSNDIANSDEESATSDVDEVGQEDEAALPVISVDPEVEKILHSWRDLHQKTSGLQSFLTEVLLEEMQEHVVVPSCSGAEGPSVREVLSPNRHIAEVREQLKTHEEYPHASLPDDIEESLDKCAQMLAALDKPNA